MSSSQIPDWEIDPIQPESVPNDDDDDDLVAKDLSLSQDPPMEIHVPQSPPKDPIDPQSLRRRDQTKQRHQNILDQAAQWVRELEEKRDGLHRLSLQNAVTLDFLAMQGLDEPTNEHDLAGQAMATAGAGEHQSN